jgi:AcrR family transcriptional regulator
MTGTKTRRRPGRERLLAAADRLFYTEGINSVGVERIAAEADVSKATLYANFTSKDDLVAQYLRGRSGHWRAYLADELARRDDGPGARILAVFDILGCAFEPGYGGCPFIKAEAECGTGSLAHAVNLEHRAWLQALFADLARQAGLSAPDEAARQLSMLYDGAMVAAQTAPSPRWAASARHAAQLILDAG